MLISSLHTRSTSLYLTAYSFSELKRHSYKAWRFYIISKKEDLASREILDATAINIAFGHCCSVACSLMAHGSWLMAHTILATDTPNCSAGYHPSSQYLRHSSSQIFFALGTFRPRHSSPWTFFALDTLRPNSLSQTFFAPGTFHPIHFSLQTLFTPDALHPKHSSPWALFTLCPRLGELVRRPLVFAI